MRPDTVARWAEPRRTVFGNIRLAAGDIASMRPGPQVGVWTIHSRLIDWNSSLGEGPSDVMIAEDGRLFVPLVYERGTRNPDFAPGGRLTVAALIYLAKVLGYPAKS